MRGLLLVILFPLVLGSATPARAQEEAAPQNDWMVHMDRSAGVWRYLPDRIVLVPGGAVQLMVFGDGRFSLTLDDGTRDADIASESGTIRTAELAAPAQPGEYPFHDKYHPEARGVLVVRERASETPAQPPVIGVVPGGYESQFSPREIRVAPGSEVAFRANGTFGHNLQAVDGSFSAGDLRAGEESSFVAPTAPGEYSFECRFHKDLGMVGVLVVEEGAPGAPPARAPGPTTPPPAATAAPSTTSRVDVVLLDHEIQPRLLQATAGRAIAIRNDGATPHTFTARDGSFDTGRIEPGATATVTIPEREGAIRVYCRYHASPDSRPEDAMAADVLVAARASAPVVEERETSGAPGAFWVGAAFAVALAFRRRSAG